ANAPVAVLRLPVVLWESVLTPPAELKLPVVFEKSAERPNAVLTMPSVKDCSAAVPPAVLPLSSLSVGFGGGPPQVGVIASATISPAISPLAILVIDVLRRPHAAIRVSQPIDNLKAVRGGHIGSIASIPKTARGRKGRARVARDPVNARASAWLRCTGRPVCSASAEPSKIAFPAPSCGRYGGRGARGEVRGSPGAQTGAASAPGGVSLEGIRCRSNTPLRPTPR